MNLEVIAMILKIEISSIDGYGDSAQRTYNYINGDYVGFIASPYTSPPPAEPPTVAAVLLPKGYDTFYGWADAVVAGIATLTKNDSVNLTGLYATIERDDEQDGN